MGFDYKLGVKCWSKRGNDFADFDLYSCKDGVLINKDVLGFEIV